MVGSIAGNVSKLGWKFEISLEICFLHLSIASNLVLFRLNWVHPLSQLRGKSHRRDLIWRRQCKARDFSNDQVTKLYIATDGRFRLNPATSFWVYLTNLTPRHKPYLLLILALSSDHPELQSSAQTILIGPRLRCRYRNFKFSFKETTIIRPAHETPKHCLKISELDLLVPSIHVPGVYFYRRPNNSSDFFEAGLLKEALSKVLVPYYPMAGRLGRAENRKFIDINCNGEGVLSMEAETTSVIDDLGDFESTIIREY
ncbi:hypothetical protein WN944_022103 [Citrus x changshan-huyou]|uniref:Uncharacterized protein n=1 Tax=Citrus x changshan-huyou TaxID=2935761 RepID=A0AAP0N2G4_9ROSI